MTLVEFLKDSKKALGAFGILEGQAVALGLLDNATAGYVTAGIGAVTAGVVYALRNIPPTSKPAPAPAKPTP